MPEGGFGRIAEITMLCLISQVYLRYLKNDALVGCEGSNTFDHHRRSQLRLTGKNGRELSKSVLVLTRV